MTKMLTHIERIGCLADNGDRGTCNACPHDGDGRACAINRCLSIARRVKIISDKQADGTWKESIMAHPYGNNQYPIVVVAGCPVWAGRTPISFTKPREKAESFEWYWDGQEWSPVPIKV